MALRIKFNGDVSKFSASILDEDFSWANLSLNTEHQFAPYWSYVDLSVQPKAGVEILSITTNSPVPFVKNPSGNWGMKPTSAMFNSSTLYEFTPVIAGAAVKFFNLNLSGNSDHFESVTLNGVAWDGMETRVEWGGAGTTNTVVVVFKEAAVVDSFSKFDIYDDVNHEWIRIGKLVGQTYTADFNYEGSYDDGSKTIELVSYMETVDVSSPFNKLFYMDREKLTELSLVMPRMYGNRPGELEAKDQSGYIINMLILPFDIPSDVLDIDARIVIGTQDSGVLAPLIRDDSITIDLGNIVVDGLSGNTTDYVGAKYELIFPFSAQIANLEPSLVLGKTLSVKYDLDPYTGNISINVFNGTDVPIFSASDRVGREIPFKLFNDPISNMGAPITLNNNIMSPILRITKAELMDGEYDNLITVNAVIGDSTGYVEIENADLRGIPDTSVVMSLLRGGVVIR